MKVGALTPSAVCEEPTPTRGAASERAADTSRSVPGPSLSALVPVGSLVVAGLLVAMLAWLARPTLTSTVDSSLEEAPDLGLPTADEVECDGSVWRVGPTVTR